MIGIGRKFSTQLSFSIQSEVGIRISLLNPTRERKEENDH